LREMFTHPDEWSEARKKADVLGYADWVMNQQFTDSELRAWLPMVHKWGLKFGLEVGAIKPWGQTAMAAFKQGSRYWDRFQSLGGKIDAITMDEPLCYCRFENKKFSDAYALEQTAQYIALVRHKYPDMTIEETEPYPSIPVADHITWIDALQARLKQLNVRGMDSYRLDVNWANFVTEGMRGNGKAPGNWVGVTQIEKACRARKIPFDLIYWGSVQPALEHKGQVADWPWYVEIMSEGEAYKLVGGKPDIYCIESWTHRPLAVPESDQWSFSRSVIDFCDRFVKEKK